MKILPQKESMTVEFKSDLKLLPDSELVDEVVGLANTKGGTIYLGIEDDGKVTGAHKKHCDPNGVIALISNRTTPSVSVQANLIYEIEGNDSRAILEIIVPKSKSIVSTSGGKILRRRLKLDGSPEIVPMYPYEIPTRLSELSVLDYSAQKVTQASVDDISSEEISGLRKIIQENQASDKSLLNLDDEELCLALHLITKSDENDGIFYPTVAGLILVGKAEKIEKFVPTAKSEFQVLDGTTVRVNEESYSSILSAIEKFEAFFSAWNPENEFQEGFYRIGIPEFDLTSFREALVNAFCHRDYTILGAVRILIDGEGLSITSPGCFIDGISAENLLSVEPHGRNPCLADILKRIGLAEKTGRGIDRIYEGQILYGREWPDYTESTSRYVRVFLQRAKPDFNFYKMIRDAESKSGKSFSISQLLILSLLKKEGKISKKKILEKTQLSELRFETAIMNLADLNLIKSEGNPKNPLFILDESKYKSEKFAQKTTVSKLQDSSNYFEQIKEFAEANGNVLTKENLSILLSISPNQAYTLIKDFVKKGKMEITQKGKYSQYRLISN